MKIFGGKNTNKKLKTFEINCTYNAMERKKRCFRLKEIGCKHKRIDRK